MSTGAKIKVPFKRKDYYVESDGYPDTIVPYLRNIVENSMEKAKEKYKNPDENWLDQLQLDFDNRIGGLQPELVMYNSQVCDYYYKITEDGKVLYRKSEEEDWKNF